MKKTFLKRFAAVVVAMLIVIPIASCNPGKTEQEKFDEFLTALPAEWFSSTDMNLNFMFDDPSKFGIKEELLTLPFATEEDYKDSKEQLQDVKKRLTSFKKDQLDESSQLTYDIMADYLDRSQLTLDYYDLDNSYLGSFIGFQAQLPLLLNEYAFNRKGDLDSYFNILETSGDTFHQYAEMEKRRQTNGVGMSKKILNKVIEQCENFVADENNFLIGSINTKIDQMDFLNDAEKSAAKEKNESLIQTKLIAAYRTLGEELKALEPTASESELGLWSMPNGKEYYETLLKVRTGSDMDIPTVKKYLNEHIEKYTAQFVNFVMEHQKEYEQLIGGASISYSDFTTPNENMDYLAKEMLKDYPPISNLNYKINQVPDAMKDNFSPAAYLTSKVDTPLDQEEAIYINGDYKPSLFTTLAHEGYPGHMYQTVYFKSLQLPTIRYIIDYNGYTEGWATYIENNSVKYVPNDQVLAEMSQYNQRLVQCYIALADIGMHYDGWDKEQFGEFLKQNFGDLPQESIDGQYDLNLETPTNYLQYYLNGMLFQDMYDDAKAELGDLFSPVEFHKVILETGPASVKILKSQVDKYVEKTQSDNQKAA